MERKKAKTHVCLICWGADRAAMRAKELKVLGYRVTVVSESVRRWIGFLGDLAPDAVVLDLDRLPSHGREVGLHLRASKTARYLPLVYLGGLAEKTAGTARCEVCGLE